MQIVNYSKIMDFVLKSTLQEIAVDQVQILCLNAKRSISTGAKTYFNAFLTEVEIILKAPGVHFLQKKNFSIFYCLNDIKRNALPPPLTR